jgi:hypothetical protein
MAVPGSNILKSALRVIASQTVDYYQDIGRDNNIIGLDLTSYAPPAKIRGSVQAVPLSAYEALGLDFGKNYVTLYTGTPLIGVERDVSGDIFTFSGKIYQCKATTNWIAIDGWNAVIAVEVKIGSALDYNFIITPENFYVVTPENEFVIMPFFGLFFVSTPSKDFVVTPLS